MNEVLEPGIVTIKWEDEKDIFDFVATVKGLV
jgi:hypothetical protein